MRYQQSEKGRASRDAYMARRKAKLAEKFQIKEIMLAESKPEMGKIEKVVVSKK